MLGVKKIKLIQTLIDMLELDSSEHVRIMVNKIKNKILLLSILYIKFYTFFYWINIGIKGFI